MKAALRVQLALLDAHGVVVALSEGHLGIGQVAQLASRSFPFSSTQ